MTSACSGSIDEIVFEIGCFSVGSLEDEQTCRKGNAMSLNDDPNQTTRLSMTPELSASKVEAI